MRPIRLTLTAFGPYAKTEIVDFREALDNGLFGIYGETGSGKSTIFSAITFALFGEAAKGDQETVSLRSDHAEQGVLTEIEFIFEVAGKRYLIRRRPEQKRPTRKGDSETTETHKAWLFDVSGLAVEAISQENQGQVIAERKVGAVKDAIIDLLGYGVEQFKQIVFLPQGKFETFLSAKTDERLKILRELFDVSLYRYLSQQMKEKAREADNEVRRDREVCGARLSQEGFESPDALQDGIASAVEHQVQAIQVEKEAKSIFLKANDGLVQGEQLAEKFRNVEAAKAVLARVEEDIPQMAAQELRVRGAEKAKSLLDVDEAVIECNKRVKADVGAYAVAQKAHEDARWAKEEAETRLEEEEARDDERENLRGQIETLVRYEETLLKAEGLREEWLIKAKRSGEAQAALDEAVAKLRELQARRTETNARSQRVQSETVRREKLCRERAALEQSRTGAKEYHESYSRLAQAQSDETRLAQQSRHFQGVLQDAESNLADAERNLSASQAIHLAGKLLPGQPCPVCGALDHPELAKGDSKSAGLDKAFRIARDKYEEAQRQSNDAAKELSSAEARVVERQASLSRLTAPERELGDIEEELQTLDTELDHLGSPIALEGIVEELAELDRLILAAEGKVEEARQERDDRKTQAAVAQHAYDGALETIPEGLRTKGTLQEALSRAREDYRERLEAYDIAREEEQCAREAAIAAARDLEAADKNLKAVRREAEAALQKFAERLAACGFSMEQYELAKHDIDQLEMMRAQIEVHKETLTKAKSHLAISAAAIEGREPPELDALRGLKLEAETEFEARAREASQAKSRVDHLNGLQASISDELSRIDKLERDTATVRNLAALFNAQNSAKLELETFAIGAMFDQVLQAANLRLGPMSNGRYSLEREIDGGKGTARRGLGIRVHDIFTGKPRPTTTLSGGETFIAALALALGLSDVVESSVGNVRLDTLFIDEGFGSLDTENDTGTLDQVLQTLQDLVGDNRAVGLISHVPLVQQAIPNGFFIKKTPAGSHVEARKL